MIPTIEERFREASNAITLITLALHSDHAKAAMDVERCAHGTQATSGNDRRQ
jgi:hypothetical protein